MALPKTQIVSLVQASFEGDRSLRQTYMELGLPDYRADSGASRDLLFEAALFIFLFCIDEDGYYNSFSHPITSVVPTLLKINDFILNLEGYAVRMKELITAGNVSSVEIRTVLETYSSGL